MRLGPEWRGKLPPGAQEQLERTLRSWRESGLVTRVEILGVQDCPVSLQSAGVLFPLDAPPRLPIEGCKRSPCCACDYSAVLDDEGGVAAKPVKETALLRLCRIASNLLAKIMGD